MTSSASALPFDDIRNLVAQMPGPDAEAVADVRAREGNLTKPAGSLGRMEEIVEWLAGWSGKSRPKITRPMVAIFAANHGVAAKGVSAYPPAVTRQMVENFAAGGAAINQICIAHDLGLKVFDLALDMPTPDITEEDAFDEAMEPPSAGGRANPRQDVDPGDEAFDEAMELEGADKDLIDRIPRY